MTSLAEDLRTNKAKESNAESSYSEPIPGPN